MSLSYTNDTHDYGIQKLLNVLGSTSVPFLVVLIIQVHLTFRQILGAHRNEHKLEYI